MELLFHQHMIRSPAKRKWGSSSRCVWAGSRTGVRDGPKASLKMAALSGRAGDGEMEAHMEGMVGTLSLREQETRLGDARWPCQPRELVGACEPHFSLGKG